MNDQHEQVYVIPQQPNWPMSQYPSEGNQMVQQHQLMYPQQHLPYNHPYLVPQQQPYIIPQQPVFYYAQPQPVTITAPEPQVS